MIRPAIIFISATALVCLTACESDQQQKPVKHKYGYTGDNNGTVVGPADTGSTESNNGPAPVPDNGGPIAPPPQTPPPPPTQQQANGNGAAPQKADYPYAQPVPGKPGYVVSPYAPGSGYVDVRGWAPGTEVKDPYTGKIFLVP